MQLLVQNMQLGNQSGWLEAYIRACLCNKQKEKERGFAVKELALPQIHNDFYGKMAAAA